MSSDMDERYAAAREHYRLVERVATVEADMRQIGPALSRIETSLAAQRAPHSNDHAILALHDVAKSLRENAQQGGGIGQTLLVVLALIGVGLGAFLVGRLF